jgi:aryl-alcohol dehydrogenase-like predicted oxidoreductase
MAAQAHAVLEAAWEAGVRYFDAARSYGRAENFLADWLQARGILPDEVTVGSKWGYTYTAGWQVQAERHEVKEHSRENLRRQAAESQAILGSHLDLYQIHSATLESGVLENAAVLTELARLRDTGWRIGLSLTGPRQAETLRRALDIVVGGRTLFSCVQATWNLLEPSVGPALALAKAAGWGVIIKEALANGRLTSRNDHPSFVAKRQRLEEMATRWGVGLDALALAAVLAQPWADVVLSGAARVEHLRANLLALCIPAEDLESDTLGGLAEPAEEYWQTRARLPWN